jgi:precorrin-4 methylase
MLSGYKTYITAGVAILTAAAAYLTGDMTVAETLQLVVTALLGAFLRSGVAAK